MNNLVESATILAGQLRVPMCYVCDKPRAVIEYARNSPTYVMQDELTGRAIMDYYDECRKRGAFVGD